MMFDVRRRRVGRLPRVHDVVVNQFALPHYRQRFLDALASSGADILFLVGDRQFGPGVVSDADSPIVHRTGSNVFLLGRRLGWQRGCVGRGLRARYLVVELNPRNLTSWLLLVLRRTIGRRTGGWGHAHSRRGPATRYNRLRRVMQGMCDELITYTETEARELRTILPGTVARPARNALYSTTEMARFTVRPVDERPDLLLIGRLVPEKKALLGVEAFAKALPELPDDVLLHVVGSGPQESEIREYVAAAGLAERVRLHGWVTDDERLAPILEHCCAVLSPGYIGLNATQALGYGAAVLYARDEPHAPEIEALTPANSRAFGSDDAEACRRTIVEFHRDRAAFDASAIAAAARAEYSIERMIEPFLHGPDDRQAAPSWRSTPPGAGGPTARHRRLRKVVKLARLVRVPRYRRALRLGVAAAVEHDAIALPSHIRTVLDVGAHQGQFALIATRRWPEAALMCFEPLAEPRSTLERVLVGHPALRVVDAAAGERCGTAEFHVSRSSDSSSLLPITEKQVSTFPGTEVVHTRSVRLTRLDTELGNATIVQPSLLKIDVQGAELQVLGGAVGVLDQIDVIVVECSFVELYAGQALAADVIRFLDEHGFGLVDVGNPTRDAAGRAVQTDLVFRRS
jgi:FkbM family methyltransferase